MNKFYIVAASAMLAMATTTAAQTFDRSKLSPRLAQLIISPDAQARSAQNLDGTDTNADKTVTVDVLAKLQPDADRKTVLNTYNCELTAEIGEVLIVRMPLNQVAPMSEDQRVVRLEAERAPRPMLDLVSGQIGSDKVNQGTDLPQAFTGKGVVVGIVDSGFDYINPFFRDANGTTRVKWAADYLKGNKMTTTEEVTEALHSSDAFTMYHGTHVAGIAAGSRVNDINDIYYQGIATEADIAEGAVNTEIATDGTGLSSATSLQAFNDIFAWAKEQGKPCVINYSMGDAMSFANNRQLEEEAISTLLQEPGRAIVVSAGNSGNSMRLAHKPADMTEGGTGIWFDDQDQYNLYFGVELKVKPDQTIRLRHTDNRYLTTKAETSVTAAELEGKTTLTLGTKRLTVLLREQTADGYDIIYLTAGLTTFSTSEAMLITIKGEGDAWIYADPLCAQLNNVATVENHSLAQDGYSMTWPAEMDEVITVGNIAHRLKIVTTANKYAAQGGEVQPTDLTPYESTKGEGYLAKSSSVGPTLTGHTKPDVCAPGVNIVSAENFFIDDDTYYALAAWDMSALDTEYEYWGGIPGYFHILAQTGTSMSAPAVTGTIALWMQADPTLTTKRIKDIIAHSSRRPDSELTYPNNQYGYGEIDAYKGLLLILDPTGILNISRHQPGKASFRLNGRLLHVDFADNASQKGEATLQVYNMDGRLLMKQIGSSIDLSMLPQGVYAVQLTTADRATTGSTLIRL